MITINLVFQDNLSVENKDQMMNLWVMYLE